MMENRQRPAGDSGFRSLPGGYWRNPMNLRRATEHPLFKLSDGRVEVWCIDTAAPAHVIRGLESVLSADEKDRAARFRFERHRDAFIVARAGLRVLLARFLGRPAAAVTFVYGPNGKPSLPDSTLEFNLSHTEGIALFAFSEACALGVDVECIHPIPNMMDIANRFFCRGEAQELAALPEVEREDAFFVCWTRKEAYLKATGSGLSPALNSFQVTLCGEAARLVHFGNDPAAALECVLHDLHIKHGYAAAIAHRAGSRPVMQSPLLPAAFLLDTPPGVQ